MNRMVIRIPPQVQVSVEGTKLLLTGGQDQRLFFAQQLQSSALTAAISTAHIILLSRQSAQHNSAASECMWFFHICDVARGCCLTVMCHSTSAMAKYHRSCVAFATVSATSLASRLLSCIPTVSATVQARPAAPLYTCQCLTPVAWLHGSV
jgi:hypothetical protein